jgi:uncharacterized protein (TIGR04141 family)
VSDKTNKLNIYLVKDGIPFDGIIKEGVEGHPLAEIGVLYGANSSVAPPSWFRDFFGVGIESPFRLFNASSKAVLLMEADIEGSNRTFAIVFGHGRTLLREGVVEERFGLKIVLNSMVADSFRSVDRTSLGSVPKQSREQTSRESSVAGFGLDIEQDLVRSVTARSNDRRFGRTITGRDGLTVSAKYDANDIRDLLRLTVERFKSTDYQAEYDWIDQIKDVRDPSTITALEGELVQRVTDRSLEKIWMAAPEILDWVDVKGFRYSRRKSAPLHDDLDIIDFLETLGAEALTIELLQSKPIVAISSSKDDVADEWNAFRCIYAESDHDGRSFVLNNGRWYEIAKSFADEVKSDFKAVPTSTLGLPKYAHDDEGAYNEAATLAIAGACCMDRKMIQHGGGHSKIEFCDVLTGDGKVVHVKRYSGSAQLSHLFAQGAVSGELFVQDSQFRAKLNDKLPAEHKLADPLQQPDARGYEIVFGIIGAADDLDIPFFSKVSLRNARRRLMGYGYKVSLLPIAAAAEPATEGE